MDMAGSPSPPDSLDSTSPLFSAQESPHIQTDNSKSTYFTPLASPPLDNSIPLHLQDLKDSDRRDLSRHGSVSSITFQPSGPELSSPSWGRPKQRNGRHRRSSPPAPSRFQHHVSFDNFAGGEGTEKNTISFTLNVKHTGYQYNKRSRTFMVGIDENSYSDYALQWMLDELVDDGDEIVCLRVVDKDAKISSDKSMDKKLYREEAKALMQNVQTKNGKHRAISIVLEFAVGKVHTTFQKMIQLYEPSMLIVGTRGRSLGGFQGLVSNRNSFSKWCLQYSPIPVVVVRPTEKRDKKKQKRANDPTRQSYVHILNDSGRSGHHEASMKPGESIMPIDVLPAIPPESEAHEVAAALGLPARFDPTLKPISFEGSYALRKLQSGKSDVTNTSRRSSSPGSRPSSPGVVLKSPKSAQLDSPAMSDEDSEDDEGEFEAVSGQSLLQNQPDAVEKAVEKQMKLHQMEVGEAAALQGRKASIGSIDSTGTGGVNGDDDEG